MQCWRLCLADPGGARGHAAPPRNKTRSVAGSSHPTPVARCSRQVLTKSLLPLPDKWHGLADVEQRYRKRCAGPRCGGRPGRAGLGFARAPASLTAVACTRLAWPILDGQSSLVPSPAWPALSLALTRPLPQIPTVPRCRGTCRYLDMIVTPGVVDTFRARSKTISTMRRMLEDQGVWMDGWAAGWAGSARGACSGLEREHSGAKQSKAEQLLTLTLIGLAPCPPSTLPIPPPTHPLTSLTDFLEVETPVLESSAGGADARPFVT